MPDQSLAVIVREAKSTDYIARVALCVKCLLPEMPNPEAPQEDSAARARIDNIPKHCIAERSKAVKALYSRAP